MKRAIGILTAFVIGASVVPASAGLPGAGGGLYQRASGSWIEMDGRRGAMYVAWVERFADAGVRTQAMIAKGRCTKTKTEFFTFIECFAYGRMKDVPVEAFQMDPLLRTASLRVAWGKHAHAVDWEAKRPASFTQTAEAGAWGADVIVEGSASAHGGGKLFGARVNRCSMCYLMEAGGVGVFTRSAAPMEVTREGDRMRFEFRKRIRS